ncbi:MAG: hypothetical protein A2731_03845 [Candidatus Buchananbacteria bacterium RIFCSPHIGHO2_01_FULL_39_8]|uniref:Phosphoribosyl-ATP pyrophosphohydrolase n=1 Tax=Candidatus Buchananbacteria bacterium RIFCSPHIGHO2_01_FULL_39_8 TaxID=1797533 RepID=A0A1G1XTV7_9BACT|nr:MAG: hypothetical protein A2731_03845 [Candidatus Buchananbacteria bacterium RIFCSPHIGHO2_01_FULL_39_8]
MKKIYNKLVRDKIPQICRQDNHIPQYKVINQVRFKQELKKKLLEESKELIVADKYKLKDEIADVHEILLNIAKAYGIRWPEVEKYRKEKNKKRGSFRKRYFLVSTKSKK